MYVKIVLKEDITPTRFYGPYDRVSFSEPVRIQPNQLEVEDGQILSLFPEQWNILIRATRSRLVEDKILESLEVIVVGASVSDIYLLGANGSTLEVAWRSRWLSSKIKQKEESHEG